MNIFALVIDDEPQLVERILNKVKVRLTERGHSFAYNLQEDITSACESFSEWKNIDLVWLDLIGVVKSGHNLIEGLKKEIPLIRKANRLAPILVVSKQTDPDIIIQAVDLGVSSYEISTSLPTGAGPVFNGDKEADSARWKPFIDKIVRLAKQYRPIKRHYGEPRSFGVFRKTGNKKESEAVERQFRFLEEVMQYPDLGGLFPEIVGSPNEEQDRFSYETTYFEIPTLRTLLFGLRNQSEMLRVGKHVLSYVVEQLFSRLYSKRLGRPDAEFVSAWFSGKYSRRLQETKDLLAEVRKNAQIANPILAELNTKEELKGFLPSLRQIQLTDLYQIELLLNAESVRVDSSTTVWRAPAEIITELLAQPAFLEKITPARISWIHGDLHLANILVDHPHPEIFHVKFIDPGGYLEGHDAAYDIGKLLHSLHGEYDFIHEGYIKIRDVAPDGDTANLVTGGYDFLDWITVPLKGGGSGDISETLKKEVTSGHRNAFAQLALHLEHLIDEGGYFADDPHWRLRAHFHEAMHFCTMAKFHLKEDPKRTATIILRGIQLMNEFYSNYENGLFDKS